METVKTNGYYGPTLYSFFKNSDLSKNEELTNLVNQYQKLNINYSYEFPGYPKYRFMAKAKSSSDLIHTLSAKSNTLKEFKEITTGIIPFYQHQQLFEILEAVEPLYDDLIWEKYYPIAQQRLQDLEDYTAQINLEEKLTGFERIFESSWSKDIPVIFSFSVVPGDVVRLVPRPQGNVVFCGLLTESDDYSWYAGLLAHEFSHRAFAEKSLESHQQIERWFNNSKSPDRFMVNFMLNEVLGGAIGHKMKEDLAGAHKFSYGQSYVRDFDEAMYPLVVSYLNEGRKLDEYFIKQSIKIYGETFPDAHKEFQYLFQNYYLLSDTKDYPISRMIRKNIASPLMYEKNYPILNEQNIIQLKKYDFTRLIVISKNHINTFDFLRDHIPDLNRVEKLDYNSDFVLSFLDDAGKAYIIINLHSMENFTDALELLKSRKMIDSNNPVVHLNKDF